MIKFIREFIIGFGFLTGFWIFVGVDPESVLVNTILQTMSEFIAPIANTLGFIHILIGIGGAGASIWATYKAGGEWGIIATIIAFTAGLFMGTIVGIPLLLFALFLGLLLPAIKKYRY